MYWLFILGLVAAGLYLFLRWGSKPIYYHHVTSTDFLRFTSGLLADGGQGALLFISHEGSNRFVQFAKYLNPKRTLYFGFPDAPWSRNVFASVQRALTSAGYRCEVRATDNDTDIPRFLCIDDIWTAEQAADIAEISFSSMGLSPDARFTIHREGPVSLQEWRWHLQRAKKST